MTLNGHFTLNFHYSEQPFLVFTYLSSETNNANIILVFSIYLVTYRLSTDYKTRDLE